jgi:hypothetical protein
MAVLELQHAAKLEHKAASPRCGRLYVRVATHSGWSSYRAWGVCDNGVIEFRGSTGAYTKEVYEILRRMVRAEAEPPEVVVRTARMLFEHFEAELRYANMTDNSFVGTAVEYDDPESPYRSFTLYMEIVRQQTDVMDLITMDGGKEDLRLVGPGWVVLITATYVGFDGHDGEGKHMVKRRIPFVGRIDSEVVWAELVRVIKMAVNALPTE